MKGASLCYLRLGVLVAPMLLSACAGTARQAPGLAAAQHAGADALLLRTQSPDRLHVEGLGEVQLGRSYQAASGRLCRRLHRLDGESLPMRSCRLRSGEWQTTRSLSPVPLLPQSHLSTTEASRKMVEMNLNVGESLWSFAARVTGDPMNWKQIAADNEIADADMVRPDRKLQIESSLLKSTR